MAAMSTSSKPYGSAPEVAVVGGGISGMTCATRLAKQGYNVTVFDMGKGSPGAAGAAARTVQHVTAALL